MNFFRHKNFTWMEAEHPHFVPLPRVQVQVVEVVHSGFLQESRAWLKAQIPAQVWGEAQLKQGWAYPVPASKHVAPVPNGGTGVGGSRGRGLALGRDRDSTDQSPGDKRGSAQLRFKASKDQSEKAQPVNHPVCRLGFLMDGRPENSLKMEFISSLLKCVNFAFSTGFSHRRQTLNETVT